MKVTTELKHLIQRSFEEKKSEISKKYKEQVNTEYEKMLKKFNNSKEFKNYQKACAELYKAFEKEYEESRDYYNNSNCKEYAIRTYCRADGFGSLLNQKADDFVDDNTDYYIKYHMNDIVKKEKTELDRQQESLMINLTYEKDIDKIKEMLAKYDIVI